MSERITVNISNLVGEIKIDAKNIESSIDKIRISVATSLLDAIGDTSSVLRKSQAWDEIVEVVKKSKPHPYDGDKYKDFFIEITDVVIKNIKL